MQPAPRLIYEWMRESFYSFTELVTFNLLWVGLTLPIVTAPAAIAGLYYATNQLAHGERVDWHVFMVGFRKHFWLGWRWALLNLLVFGVLLTNVRFYGQFDATWAIWAQGLVLGLLVLWALLQLYTFPLLLEQTEPRLRQALRNSAVLYVRRPGLSLALGVFIALLAGISTFLLPPAWIIFTAGVCAYLANQGAIAAIASMANQPQPQG